VQRRAAHGELGRPVRLGAEHSGGRIKNLHINGK
jgi:hypothetical protein